MTSTSINLLKRLSDPAAEAAWSRFVDLYSPMIYLWARQRGLGVEDSADIMQEVAVTMIAKFREFEYDPTRRFRSWLQVITVNRVIDFKRRAVRHSFEMLQAEPADDLTHDAAFLNENEYRQQLVRSALNLLRVDFHETTWQAGWRQLVAGEAAPEVAKQLGISLNAAYLAKSPLLARLRVELKGFLD